MRVDGGSTITASQRIYVSGVFIESVSERLIRYLSTFDGLLVGLGAIVSPDRALSRWPLALPPPIDSKITIT